MHLSRRVNEKNTYKLENLARTWPEVESLNVSTEQGTFEGTRMAGGVQWGYIPSGQTRKTETMMDKKSHFIEPKNLIRFLDYLAKQQHGHKEEFKKLGATVRQKFLSEEA